MTQTPERAERRVNVFGVRVVPKVHRNRERRTGEGYSAPRSIFR